MLTDSPAVLLPTEIPLLEIAGTPSEAGNAYGSLNREPIISFFYDQIKATEVNRRYARKCWKELCAFSPSLAAFVEGTAGGAEISRDEAMLLMLHEELAHMPHCTAFGATGAATVTGGTLIGQNWDWIPSLYGRSQLLRLSLTGAPRMLCYGYPGLWAGVGMNEEGLALVWTSSGIWPKISPLPGVPTYAVIAEVLAQRSVAEAVALLQRTRNAGCFIFFLGDASGALCVVEGWPHHQAYVYPNTVARANHFLTKAAMSATNQQVNLRLRKRNCSPLRCRLMKGQLRKVEGRIDLQAAMGLLCYHEPQGGSGICCHPNTKQPHTSLDSLIADCERRELYIARGFPCRHEYRCYSVFGTVPAE